MRILLAFLLLTLAVPAQADHCASYGARYQQQREWPFSIYRERYCRHWARSEATRVYAYERRDRYYHEHDDSERWERRDPSSEKGVSCKTEVGPIRVIGGKHLTQPGAIKDAVGRWESSIGYDYGEKYMSMENARGYRWRCDKASTNETTLGRVGENIAGAITGGNADAYYKRCVVIALPCMRPVERGDEDKR